MNANELADALQETEPYYSTDYKLFDKAATMLRQQQAEIEVLKTENSHLKYEISSGAWNPVKKPTMVLDGNRVYPAFKELTDEDIKEAMEFAGIRPSKEWGLATTGNVQLIIFARAILKKAQAK